MRRKTAASATLMAAGLVYLAVPTAGPPIR